MLAGFAALALVAFTWEAQRSVAHKELSDAEMASFLGWHACRECKSAQGRFDECWHPPHPQNDPKEGDVAECGKPGPIKKIGDLEITEENAKRLCITNFCAGASCKLGEPWDCSGEQDPKQKQYAGFAYLLDQQCDWVDAKWHLVWTHYYDGAKDKQCPSYSAYGACLMKQKKQCMEKGEFIAAGVKDAPRIVCKW